jgi:hypothetical protein
MLSVMRSKKSKLIWCLLLTVVGGCMGLLFAKQGILEPPTEWVVNAGRHVTAWLTNSAASSRSKQLLTLLFVTVSFAIPRTVIGGVVLGIVATRIPYPRVLFYSVLAWPLVLVAVPLGYVVRFEQWAQQVDFGSPMGLTRLETSLQHLFFYVAVSILFALSYAISFWITSTVCKHNDARKARV